MKPKSGLFVEFHGWPEGSPSYPGGVVDVTPFVMSLRWSEGTSAPWGGLSMGMAVPFRDLPDVFPGRQVPVSQTSVGDSRLNPKAGEVARANVPRYGQIPETGFWILIGHVRADGRKQTYYLARCHRIRLSVVAGADGLVETQPVTLEAENFLSFLNRSRMQFAPAGAETPWGRKGFVWDLSSWNDGLSALIGSVLQQPLGLIFETLFSEVVRISLPPSLGGTLGSSVAVVWNDLTALQYAKTRVGSVEIVTGYNMRASPNPTSSSVLSFFLNLFGADPRAVELFPCIEMDYEDASYSLVLNYRMKPWLVRAITTENVNAEVNDGRILTQDTASMKTGMFLTRTSVDHGDSGIQWYEFPKEDIESIDFSWSDDDRVNLTFSSNFSSDQGAAGYGFTGTPLIRDNEQVSRHGLRVAELAWPYYPSSLAGTTENLATNSSDSAARLTKGVDLLDYADALIELCWAVTGESERFCRGAVRTYYRPYLKPGHWGRFYLHGSCLTGYIESVSHDVVVQQDNGFVTGGTTVAFSRGTLRYYDGSQAMPPEYQAPLMTKEANDSGVPAKFEGPVRAPARVGTAGTTSVSENRYKEVEQQSDVNEFSIFRPTAVK